MPRVKIIFVFYFLFFASTFYSQANFVPNPSFENYSSCQGAYDELYKATPWFKPTNCGTSDFIHACYSGTYVGVPQNLHGYQYARTGLGYGGLIACLVDSMTLAYDYREYLEVRLTTTLTAGQKYYVSFHVSLADSVNWGTDSFGMYFSKDTLKGNTCFNFTVTPQVINTPGNFLTNKTGWTQVSGTYTATGVERFITIGNFKGWPATSVAHVPGGSKDTISSAEYLTGYYYIDDICVSTSSTTCLLPTGINNNTYLNSFEIFPNPFTDKTTLKFDNSKGGNYSLLIFNYNNQVVKRIENINENNIIVNRDDFKSGLYFFHLYNDKQLVIRGKLIVD